MTGHLGGDVRRQRLVAAGCRRGRPAAGRGRRGRVDEPTEDAAFRHLEALRDGRNAGQGRGQTADVLLHVTEQLLKLVENCKERCKERRKDQFNSSCFICHSVGCN